MKKINLSEIKSSLTKQELNKIMAGSGDIVNANKTSGCTCVYNNASYISNSNDAGGCSCRCS